MEFPETTNQGLNLEQVFKIVGVPDHTFVEPVEFNKLIVALRTPGLTVVVEGPSGIGKTTSVMRALGVLRLQHTVISLKARHPDDATRIAGLPYNKTEGTVLIDDFHVLPSEVKRLIADYIKLLTDDAAPKTKLVILGINLAGKTLIDFAPDLSGRIERLRMEINPDEKLVELYTKGEKALNVKFSDKNSMAREALGSFHLAQMIGHQTCLRANVLAAAEVRKRIKFECQYVRNDILDRISPTWARAAYNFARGVRFK